MLGREEECSNGLHKHTEWLPEEPIVLHHFRQRAQNFEKPTLESENFF